MGIGWLGNLGRDLRHERRERHEAERELRAAARHVWYEIAEFQAATGAAAAMPRLRTHELTIGPLRTRAQWNRYGDLLAREAALDFGAIQRAYAAARFAADALLEKAPTDEVRDQYRQAFQEGLDALRPLAELEGTRDPSVAVS